MSVKDFPTPTDVHSIRQFLGLASYFRKYIRNFALIAKPLTNLTKNNAVFSWDNEQRAERKINNTSNSSYIQ